MTKVKIVGREQLGPAALELALPLVLAQRDEILRAFVAKYQCGPDELVQVEEHTPTGIKWYVEKKPYAVIDEPCPICGEPQLSDGKFKWCKDFPDTSRRPVKTPPVESRKIFKIVIGLSTSATVFYEKLYLVCDSEDQAWEYAIDRLVDYFDDAVETDEVNWDDRTLVYEVPSRGITYRLVSLHEIHHIEAFTADDEYVALTVRCV